MHTGWQKDFTGGRQNPYAIEAKTFLQRYLCLGSGQAGADDIIQSFDFLNLLFRIFSVLKQKHFAIAPALQFADTLWQVLADRQFIPLIVTMGPGSMPATACKLRTLFIRFCLATLLLSGSGSAAPVADTTLADTKTAAALQMLQSDDPQAVSHYVDAELHPDTLQSFAGQGRERYIAYLSDLKRFHRALQLGSTPQLSLQNGQQQISAQLRSANTELNYLLQLNLSAQPPFQVTMVDLRDAPATTRAGAKLTMPQLTRQLSAYVDRLASRGVFSGAVLLADAQGVLYQSAKGMADLRFQVPNTVETRFNLASMNKMFTAISMLQLAQAKKLSLQDKLVRYVDPSLFASADFQHITLQQLLNHTAGLGWPEYPDQQHHQFRQLQQFRPLLKHLSLTAKPGSRFTYSNEGMLLLGMVIEQVSGLSMMIMCSGIFTPKLAWWPAATLTLMVWRQIWRWGTPTRRNCNRCKATGWYRQ